MLLTFELEMQNEQMVTKWHLCKGLQTKTIRHKVVFAD